MLKVVLVNSFVIFMVVVLAERNLLGDRSGSFWVEKPLQMIYFRQRVDLTEVGPSVYSGCKETPTGLLKRLHFEGKSAPGFGIIVISLSFRPWTLQDSQ